MLHGSGSRRSSGSLDVPRRPERQAPQGAADRFPCYSGVHPGGLANAERGRSRCAAVGGFPSLAPSPSKRTPRVTAGRPAAHRRSPGPQPAQRAHHRSRTSLAARYFLQRRSACRDGVLLCARSSSTKSVAAWFATSAASSRGRRAKSPWGCTASKGLAERVLSVGGVPEAEPRTGRRQPRSARQRRVASTPALRPFR
jgi:hypothetical protein